MMFGSSTMVLEKVLCDCKHFHAEKEEKISTDFILMTTKVNITQTSHIHFGHAPCYELYFRSKVHRHLVK